MHVAFSQHHHQHIIIPRSAIEKCGAPAGSLVMHGVCVCYLDTYKYPRSSMYKVQRAVLLLFTFAFITPANLERASERSRLRPELLSFRTSLQMASTKSFSHTSLIYATSIGSGNWNTPSCWWMKLWPNFVAEREQPDFYRSQIQSVISDFKPQLNPVLSLRFKESLNWQIYIVQRFSLKCW